MGRSHATCDCTHCVYCDMPVPKRHEHDHMPIPQAFGGESVVAACMNCHELKDRTLLGDWPVKECIEAFVSLPPLGRILMAKIIAVGYHTGNLT